MSDKKTAKPPTHSNHHFFPKSLGGENDSVNIQRLPHQVHVQLHQIMNLPGIVLILYRGWYGIQKPQNCSRWKEDLSKVNGMLDLQYRYYQNFRKLPWEWLRCLHMNKLHVMSEYYIGHSLYRQPDFPKAWQQYERALISHCQRHHGA